MAAVGGCREVPRGTASDGSPLPDSLHALRLVDLQTIYHGASIYRACRKQGLTVRKTVDCLIAAVCLRVDAELYHNDRDFDAIAKVEPLRIYQPA